MRVIGTVAILLLTAYGCGDKTDKADKAPTAAGDKVPAAAGEWVDLKLPKLGLVAKAPGNAKVGALGGIQSADRKCRLDVFEKSKTTPTFENMLANIEKGNKGGPLKKMEVKEKTADDAWTLKWTTEAKFGYASSRKIGARSFHCVNFQSTSAASSECAQKMCKSLRAN